MKGKIFQENAGTKTRDGKRKLGERIAELCAEQGVDPDATISEEDAKTFMKLTHAEKNLLNLIARGYPVRNASAVLRVIEMKLDRSSPRPQAGSGQGAAPVTVVVNTISAEPTVQVETEPSEESIQ